MSSAIMAVDQNGCTGLDNHLPINNKILFELGTPTSNGIKLKEQLNPADDFAPKARKPYTITKQRERWTDEEHKKFIEALKLYGRAWRKIEEHVSTKTTVQIRSHAQKFFSKVVRESSTADASSVKPIEIPPPRPKRKPMHPYPRKLVSPVNTGFTIPEKSTGSASLNTTEPDNQSPTSILSVIGSDSSVGPESSMPIGSPPSASSALGQNAGSGSGSELPKRLSEGIASSFLDHEDENSSPEDQELELLSQNNASDKEIPNESAAQILKLFGKTFLVMDPRGASYSTGGICKPEAFDRKDETCPFPCKVSPVKVPTNAADNVQNAVSDRSPTPVYNADMNSNLLYAQMTSDKSYPPNAHCAVTFPWLTLCSGAAHSTLEVHSPKPIKAQLSCDMKEMLDTDEQKEGSSNDSNTDTVGGSKWENWDSEISTHSFERKGKEEISSSSYKLSKRISAHSLNRRKGFVPYKRCLSKQDSTISSTKIARERETQCIRLCM